VNRAPGPSVRLRLALSYAAFLMVVSVLLLAVVWVFLLRYVPQHAVTVGDRWSQDGSVRSPSFFVPGRDDLWRAFWPKAAWMLGFLLLLGLVGGWLLAGRMLAPLGRITEATRRAADGSLAHRVQLPGHRDEFRELADAFDLMLGRLEAHVAEQQRFAANASHELRTPLATTRALLEVAEQDPDRNVDVLVARLQHVNERAIELTDGPSCRSRSTSRSWPRRQSRPSCRWQRSTASCWRCPGSRRWRRARPRCCSSS
jgi:two-component system sensor histidine kinase VanS